MSANEDNLFAVIIKSDNFAPRVKSGEQLILSRNIVAEDGDIVLIGSDKDECPNLAFYSTGLSYYAVAVFIILPPSRLRQKRCKPA